MKQLFVTMACAIAASSAALVCPGAEPAFVPRPHAFRIGEGTMSLSPTSRIVTRDETLRPLAQVLSEEIQMLSGVRMDITSDTPRPGDIALALTPRLEGEAYAVSVGEYARVFGGHYGAVALGTVTLLQAGEHSGKTFTFPYLGVKDAPDRPYRGVMVDVARRHNSIDVLKQCVILCRWYKLNYLHLHLTDDHAWTFPSDAFPKLGSSNRGFRGPTPIVYDKQELIDLVAFADARGVTLIPELDVPAHSDALRIPYPELFDADDGPARMGLVNMANEKTYESLAILVGEMAAVFTSSPYIHIGADEANISRAQVARHYGPYMEQHNLDDPRDLFFHFIVRMNDIVKGVGKQTIVWADFHGTGTKKVKVPTDVVCMAWRANSRAPTGYVENGYPLINATWVPLYIVNQTKDTVPVVEDARNKHRPETIYNWNLFEFHTTVVEPTDRLLGAQICAWEQGGEAQMPTLRTRLPAMSERVWDVQGDGTFVDFSRRFASTDRRLDQLIFPFEAHVTPLAAPNRWLAPPLDGYYVGDGASCALTPSVPGIAVRYLEGDHPVPGDAPVASGPISVQDVTSLSAQAYDPQGHPMGQRWHRTFERHLITGDIQGVIEPDYALPNEGHIVQTATQVPAPNQGRPPRAFEDAATVTLKALRGGIIRYTLDGTPPSSTSATYDAPVTIHDTATMVAQLFDADGAAQGEPWTYTFERTTPMPNLTLGKPVFEIAGDGAEKPLQGISPAVDGMLNADHWGVGNAPASLTIDLEEVHTLGEIHVFPYFLDRRHYTYFVEVSPDRASWTEVVDRRENRDRATSQGHRHPVEPIPARYIRVTMLSNSANPAVHLVEVRAFDAERAAE